MVHDNVEYVHMTIATDMDVTLIKQPYEKGGENEL